MGWVSTKEAMLLRTGREQLFDCFYVTPTPFLLGFTHATHTLAREDKKMMVPKSLKQQINVFCHNQAQRHAAAMRESLLNQALERLKAGESVEQIYQAILVPCSKNDTSLKL